MKELSRWQIEVIKKAFIKNTRIVCLEMNDPHGVPAGTKGTVEHVDDMGTIHCIWDNGQTLGLLPNVDHYRKISE